MNEELEMEIGRKMAIRYEIIEPVIKGERSFDLFCYNYSLKSKYTIVEYLGEGFYVDLTTGIVFQDSATNISFVEENERVDYTRINQDDYDMAMKYPFKINPLECLDITDDILIDIWNNTYPKKDEIHGFLVRESKKCQKYFEDERSRMVSCEEEKQYNEALQEMEIEMSEIKRKNDIAEAKKIYCLK